MVATFTGGAHNTLDDSRPSALKRELLLPAALTHELLLPAVRTRELLPTAMTREVLLPAALAQASCKRHEVICRKTNL